MKGEFSCPYCLWVGASDAHLARHLSRYHEAVIAEEGERKREKGKEIKSTGFDPRLHDIVQGYLHQCPGGKRGKVYDTETDTEEGIIFRWRCVECDKILREWFEKWTPDSKERYQKLKEGRLASLPQSPLLLEAIGKIGRKM